MTSTAIFWHWHESHDYSLHESNNFSAEFPGTSGIKAEIRFFETLVLKLGIQSFHFLEMLGIR